jgi:hypothetical protein
MTWVSYSRHACKLAGAKVRQKQRYGADYQSRLHIVAEVDSIHCGLAFRMGADASFVRHSCSGVVRR